MKRKLCSCAVFACACGALLLIGSCGDVTPCPKGRNPNLLSQVKLQSDKILEKATEMKLKLEGDWSTDPDSYANLTGLSFGSYLVVDTSPIDLVYQSDTPPNPPTDLINTIALDAELMDLDLLNCGATPEQEAALNVVYNVVNQFNNKLSTFKIGLAVYKQNTQDLAASYGQPDRPPIIFNTAPLQLQNPPVTNILVDGIKLLNDRIVDLENAIKQVNADYVFFDNLTGKITEPLDTTVAPILDFAYLCPG